MSAYTKQELENELENVINELSLPEEIIYKYWSSPIDVHILVRKVIEQKDKEITMLKNWFIKIK